MGAQILALIAAVILALVLHSATGTWAHPAALFAGAWAMFLAAATFLLPSANSFGGAAWIIVGLILMVAVSAPLSVSKRQVLPSEVRAGKSLTVFVLFGSSASILSALITQRANGITLSGALSLESIISASRSISVIRYDGTMSTPLLATVLLAMTYGAAFAAPFAAQRHQGFKRSLVLCGPAIGGASYALLTTARAGLLIAVAITIGSWLIVRAVVHGGRPKTPAGTLLGLVAAAAGVGVMFVFVAASRAGGINNTSASSLMDTVGLYAGGSIPAFNEWIPSASGPQFGAQTFAGVAQFLIGDSSLGSAYTGFAYIGPNVSTNVYTALRPMSEDFTVPGMFAFVALASLVAAHQYRRAVLNRSVLNAVGCSMWLGFVLFSQTTSIYSFANVTTGVILAAIFVVGSVKFAPSIGVGSAANVNLTPKQSAVCVDTAPASLARSRRRR